LAAAKFGGECLVHAIDSRTDTDLAVDTGYFSAGRSRLLVIQSGIHGPEAPAGDLAQQLALEKYLRRFLNRGIDVLFVHALNPYGFKHWRRSDEFNVNLNRNFPADAGLYSVKNEAYRDLRSLFEPEGPIGWVHADSLLSVLRLVWSYARAKFDKHYINQAMSSGQYEFERGLNFGGKGPSRQVALLKEILTPAFKNRVEILFLDFHTGLGENGVLAVMNGLHPPAEFLAKVSDYWRTLPGIAMVNANDASDANFYTDFGDVIDFVPTLASNPAGVLALTMEYGTMGVDTLSQLKTASRMILENQAHFNGCESAKACEAVQNDFQELFNPSDAKWRKMVLDGADQVFSALADRF
jgi:hypothetical protein